MLTVGIILTVLGLFASPRIDENVFTKVFALLVLGLGLISIVIGIN